MHPRAHASRSVPTDQPVGAPQPARAGGRPPVTDIARPWRKAHPSRPGGSHRSVAAGSAGGRPGHRHPTAVTPANGCHRRRLSPATAVTDRIRPLPRGTTGNSPAPPRSGRLSRTPRSRIGRPRRRHRAAPPVGHVEPLDRRRAGSAGRAGQHSIDPDFGIVIDVHRQHRFRTRGGEPRDVRRDRQRRAKPPNDTMPPPRRAPRSVAATSAHFASSKPSSRRAAPRHRSSGIRASNRTMPGTRRSFASFVFHRAPNAADPAAVIRSTTCTGGTNGAIAGCAMGTGGFAGGMDAVGRV